MKEKSLPWKKMEKTVAAILLLALGLTGVGVVIFNTRFGPNINGDSIVYIQGAKNLLAGNGFSFLLGRGEVAPIRGFPPLTSVALAITNPGGGDMVQSGRWLNAILFGLNIVLAGWIVYRYSNAALPVVLTAAMIAAHPSVIITHSSVWSEGLFIFFLLSTLGISAEYFRNKKNWFLVLASLLTAACVLTRYIGIILVPVLGIGLLLFGRQDWKGRLWTFFIFGLLCLTPIVAWALRNQSISGNPIDRQIGLHFMSQDMRGLFGDTILSWFYLTKIGLGWRMRILTFAAISSASLIWFGWTVYRAKGRGADNGSGGYPLPTLLIFLFLSYVALIWVNTSLLDNTTSKSAIGRYLVPLFVPTVILATCVASSIANYYKGPVLKITFSLLGAFFIFYYGSGSLKYAYPGNDASYYGYTGLVNSWTDESSLLKQLDPKNPVVTNDIQLLYALSDRYSYTLPFVEGTNLGTPPEVDKTKLHQELSPNGFLIIIVKDGQQVSDFLPADLLSWLVLFNHTKHLWMYKLPNPTP